MRVVIMMISMLIIGCDNSTSPEIKLKHWENVCSSKLSVGTSKGQIVTYLKSQGMSYSYSDSNKTIYAMDEDVDNWRLIYESAVLIRVKLDDKGNSQSCVAELEFSGI